MKPCGCFFRLLAGGAGFSALLMWSAGCGNIFVSKHKVLVDSISAPGVTKPGGKSYRLLAKKTVVSQGQLQVPVVKACVDAALVTQGMFEPPPNVAPDLFIEVGYGTDTSGRVDPASRETFIQLSARDNPERAIDRGQGAELWDVRVAVLGIAGRVESAMPLLCAVAANYIATDTRFETRIDIPKNSPMIGSVRDAAVKALEENEAKNAGGARGGLGAPPASAPEPATAAGAPAKPAETPIKGTTG